MTTEAKDLNARALEIMGAHSKKSLINTVRAKGWRGDHARTPMLALALWLAGHEQANQQTDSKQDHTAKGQPHDEQQQQGEQSKAKGSEGATDSQQQGDKQQQGEQSGKQGDKSEGKQSEGKQGEQSEGDKSEGEQSEGDKSEGEQQGEKQGEQSEGEQGSEQQQQQGAADDEQPQQPPKPASNKEYFAALKAAGIVRAHPALRKVYEIVRQDIHARKVHGYGTSVYLRGPAGTGKTTLAAQLAKLLQLPFSFISCTAGMSESQLTGWLLPIGENGAFSYVPAPNVTRYGHGGVMLKDELDASDPNTLLVLNSALANARLSIPHNLAAPIVERHENSVILGAGNTRLGGGADERYSARQPLDASTSDRFVEIVVDYDAAYEKSLFTGEKISQSKGGWQPVENGAEVFAAGHAEFVRIRATVERGNIAREVSTRFAQKLIILLRAGFTLKDALDTLTSFWSADERSRVGVK